MVNPHQRVGSESPVCAPEFALLQTRSLLVSDESYPSLHTWVENNLAMVVIGVMVALIGYLANDKLVQISATLQTITQSQNQQEVRLEAHKQQIEAIDRDMNRMSIEIEGLKENWREYWRGATREQQRNYEHRPN